MTDPLTLGVVGAAAVVASALGWLYWPRPPALDGERWFKLAFATTLRGRAEARGEGVASWERDVARFVPYHPAGRLPERKVALPEAMALPGPALPGERELLADLARLGTVPARWVRLYDADPAGRAALLADPAELGADYDFARWFALPRLASETGWDVLAAWDDARFPAALAAGLPASWILVEGRPRGVPTWGEALAAAVPVVRVPWTGLEETTAALAHELGKAEGRVVIFGEEAGIAAVLRALLASPADRDRVSAVVSLGGVVGGDPAEEGLLSPGACGDWLAANFAHHALDTERVRFTPYFSLAWLDRAAVPPGAGGLPLEAQRFPAIRHDAGVVPMLETVDLGVLPAVPDLPLESAARALVAVVAAWARSRGA